MADGSPMRRTTRRGQIAVASGLVALPLLLALAGCSSGDAEDAEAIVQQDDSTPSNPDDSTTDDSVGTGPAAGDELPISVFELELGTCFDDPAFAADEASSIGETTAVQCFDPHDAEVYAIVAFPETAAEDYPGEEDVQDYAEGECFDRFEDFVGIPYADSRLDIATIWPTEPSWEEGDREATCVVFDITHLKLEGTMDSIEE